VWVVSQHSALATPTSVVVPGRAAGKAIRVTPAPLRWSPMPTEATAARGRVRNVLDYRRLPCPKLSAVEPAVLLAGELVAGS